MVLSGGRWTDNDLGNDLRLAQDATHLRGLRPRERQLLEVLVLRGRCSAWNGILILLCPLGRMVARLLFLSERQRTDLSRSWAAATGVDDVTAVLEERQLTKATSAVPV